MIIATIGNAKLKLEKLADAEVLLNIASRATLVGTGYGMDYQDYQYISDGEKRLVIEVTEGDTLISYAEHLARQAEREAEQRKSAPKAA